MNINKHISRLIRFAVEKQLIRQEDVVYSTNQLVGLLQLNDFEAMQVEREELVNPAPILEKILDYAVEQGIVENTITQRDLFDAQLMNALMPRPSEIIAKFRTLYSENFKKSTDYYYSLSLASNYIRKNRTDRNIIWQTKTSYGNLDITINLSKPEKDPRDIEKEKYMKASTYPKCLLCIENEGFFGNIKHPARNNHRIIPLTLNEEKWFLQYSPYVYYNEHCIVLNSEHVPMKIQRNTFQRLVDFVEQFPHYFVGSNADLPIVGGSILSHDHFQGGNYEFAMERAKEEESYVVIQFPNISVSRIAWPMSVIRARSKDKQSIVEFADHVLNSWQQYSDESVEIVAFTGDTLHHTVTPIVRMRDGQFEVDLVLRNNRTSEEHPMGIFHPHADVHHIKKENIGLIEVMGLAVLPARLKEELHSLGELLVKREATIENDVNLAKHSDWYTYMLEKYEMITKENVMDILREEVGLKFARVLEDAGVFKRDEKGIAAFNRFIQTLSCPN
ncbi:MAG: UDP-glucose--hexose-1-phosphate uridylyltransferase [Bacillaceae bacterium]